MLLAWLAAAFIAGVVAGGQVAMPAQVALAAAGGAGLVGAGLWRHRRLRLGFLLASCVLLGLARFETTRREFGPQDLAYYNGAAVTVQGTVTQEPDVRDRGINYVVSVDRLTISGHVRAVSGQVEVHTPASQTFDLGDRLTLSGRLLTPTNTPTVPYRSVLASRGVYSEMAFPRAVASGRGSVGPLEFAMELRQAIINRLEAALPDPEATLLVAILVGAHSAQLGSLAPVLVATGLIHLIAVSGVKVAIVAGMLNTAFRRALPRLPTLILSILLLGSYWLVAGATTASLRASIMWLLVFIAAYLGRPTSGLVSLGVAGAVMVAINPALPWDTGFQLTFLGTAAIVAFAPLFQHLTRRLPSALGAAISTTLAAQIGVLPVQAASFHVLSPVSVLANTVVLPLIPLTMIVGFAGALVPHGILLALAYALTHAIVVIAHTAAGIPAASFPAAAFSSGLLAGYYALVVIAARASWRFSAEPSRHPHGEYLLGSAVCALALGGLLLVHNPPAYRLVMVANDAALLETGGVYVLIDGGASPSALLAGLGRELAFPERRLDAVIDTDPRAANTAALLTAAQRYDVGGVYDPGVEYPSHTYARWRAWLDDHHVPVRALRPGLTISARDMTIRALSPDGVYANARDGAGILLISIGRRHVLYLGPASQREQQDLPFRIDVHAPVAVAPVPINSTLRAAAGIRTVIKPTAGLTLALPPSG